MTDLGFFNEVFDSARLSKITNELIPLTTTGMKMVSNKFAKKYGENKVEYIF